MGGKSEETTVNEGCTHLFFRSVHVWKEDIMSSFDLEISGLERANSKERTLREKLQSVDLAALSPCLLQREGSLLVWCLQHLVIHPTFCHVNPVHNLITCF
jgi:hypothetical protein